MVEEMDIVASRTYSRLRQSTSDLEAPSNTQPKRVTQWENDRISDFSTDILLLLETSRVPELTAISVASFSDTPRITEGH